jgi:hypothetical protein
MLENQLFGDPSLALRGNSQAPVRPSPPQGPITGKIRSSHTYTALTIDPDGDDLYYLFDWGDGSTSEWLGPHASGALCNASYNWPSTGQYPIRVKAKDVHGVESEWSDPLSVSMPLIHKVTIGKFIQILLEIIGINIA